MRLVQESADIEVTKKHFEELLHKLIKSYSVQTKLFGTRTCLSLPKGAQYLNSYEQCKESIRIKATENCQNLKIL